MCGGGGGGGACVRACVREREKVCACVHACVREKKSVRACVRACERACVCDTEREGEVLLFGFLWFKLLVIIVVFRLCQSNCGLSLFCVQGRRDLCT